MNNPDEKIISIPIVCKDEKNFLLNSLSGSSDVAPEKKSIVDIFYEQVRKSPDKIALENESTTWSYGDLNSFTNKLGYYLKEECLIDRHDTVALIFKSGFEYVISSIAVLKIGGNFVPMNGDNETRIPFILDHCNPKTVIYDINDEKIDILIKKDNRNIKFINIKDLLSSGVLDNYSVENLEGTSSPYDLSYIMYTSGTTGNAKGALIEHRGITSLAKSGDFIEFVSGDGFVLLADISFDASTFEIWCSLLNGGKLFVPKNPKDWYLNPSTFNQQLTKHGIHHLWLTKSLFEQIYHANCDAFASLKYLLVGGEALNAKTINELMNSNSCPDNIINGYGPTENTTFSTTFNIKKNYLKAHQNVPIGRPLKGRTVYILNDRHEILPMGAVGTLYVGGEGLGRGYLNDKELTKSKFIKNPFQKKAENNENVNDRIYNTNDIVRWKEDGEIEFLGRNDFQVKLNGFRIELGEIEATLNSLDNITQSVVTVLTPASGKKYLIAYYEGEKKDISVLKNEMSRLLPSYMIPYTFIYMDSLPVNSSGKIDRHLLPAPSLLVFNEETTPPRNSIESKMQSIWREILGLPLEQIGIDNDFFSLGGDSISSIQLVGRIRKEFDISIGGIDIYNHRTIGNICSNLIASPILNKSVLKPEMGQLAGELELLPIQKWFFALPLKNKSHWNQSFFISVPTLEIDRLKSAIKELMDRHGCLSLKFIETDGKIKQFYNSKREFPRFEIIDMINYESLGDINLQNKLTKIQSNFDLSMGRIVCFAYLKGVGSNDSKIFCSIHHLAVDRVSWDIIANDLQDLYYGKKLLEKGTSYRQWSDYIRNYGKQHPEEKEYWKNVSHSLNDNELIGQVQDKCVLSEIDVSFNEKDTTSLFRDIRAFRIDAVDLMLTALAESLRDVFNKSSQVILMEGHGREEMNSLLELDQTVGWFTNLYPIKLEAGDNWKSTLRLIKTVLKNLPNKGVGYGALVDLLPSKLPQIGFNFLGTLNTSSKSSWSISIENTGLAISKDNLSPLPLSIDGYVKEGRLVFKFISSLDERITNRLVKAYKDKLTDLIFFCIESKGIDYIDIDFKEIQSESDLKYLPLIPKGNEEEFFPMSEIQKVYLLGRLGNYEIGNVSNHIYHEYFYETLDIEKLEGVLNQLIRDNNVLRTVFDVQEMKQRFLKIDKIMPYTIPVNLLRQQQNDEDMLQEIRDRLSHKLYDPEKFPLFTFEVSKLKSSYVLHISMDLILLDAQSRKDLFRKIDLLYRNPLYKLEKLQINFKDYMDYTDNLKKTNWFEKDKNYWKKRLPGLPLRPEFPTNIPAGEVVKPNFKDHTIFIPKDKWEKFKEKAKNSALSYSSILLSLYGSVISFFSGKDEFIISMTLFNRYPVHNDINQIWGDFTSVNVFHYNDLDGDLLKVMKRGHELMWKDIDHALYPGTEVQRDIAKINELDPRKAVSPVVFTGVVGNKLDEVSKFLDDSELYENRYWIGQTSQAWMDLQALEVEGKFMSKWLYVEQLFNRDYIESMNKMYCSLIEEIAEKDWNSLKDIRSLPSAYTDLIKSNNQITRNISDETLFSRHNKIANNPELKGKTAIIDSYLKKEFTHEEIYFYSNNLASNIDRVGQLIGILSEKGVWEAIGVLGIMKSGNSYLPLNIDWPVSRIKEVLDEGGVSLLLVSQKEAEKLAGLKDFIEILIIENNIDELKNNYRFPNVEPDSVAYVIYTSGSTGKPKGVTITHRSAMNTIQSVNEAYNVNGDDIIVAFSSLSFDLSVYDLFGILEVGGKIVFPDYQKIKDPKHWLNLVDSYNVTLWNSVPQVANLLIDEFDSSNYRSGSLRLILLSGDWIPLNLTNKIKKNCLSSPKIVSLGGATEGSIWSIWYEIHDVDPKWRSIPYGHAMPNQKMYVLTKSGKHSPPGIPGEIHIGGMGVAKEYWRDEERTRKSFVDHPLLGRLYRTGDLGRWSEDGNIEFLGRIDNQVKISGYRVEMEEIEKKIQKMIGVGQCKVLVYKDPAGNNSLEAHIEEKEDTLPPFILNKTIESSDEKLNFLQKNLGRRIFNNQKLINKVKLLNSHTDQDIFKRFSRKSYRMFDSLKKVNYLQLMNLLRKTSEIENTCYYNDLLVSYKGLLKQLKFLSAYHYNESLLPKYSYPSAGSTYPIQIYLQLAKGVFDDVEAGTYYFDPLTLELSCFSSVEPHNGSVEIICCYNKHAIEPVYEKFSRDFALLEVGHITGLLNNISREEGYKWELNKNYNSFPIDDGVCFLSSFSPRQNLMVVHKVEYLVLIKNGMDLNLEPGWYKFSNNELHLLHKYVAKEIPVRGQNTSMRCKSSFGIFLYGKKQNYDDQLIDIGRFSQYLQEIGPTEEIGTCPIGKFDEDLLSAISNIIPEDKVHYLIWGGAISEKQIKEIGPSNSKVEIDREEQVLNLLRQELPHYMIPSDLYFYKRFPLSANGKIDIKTLDNTRKTKEQFQTDKLEPPKNSCQKDIIDIWSDILGINSQNIGISNNFFKLGGNSLLAMQMVSKLKNNLKLELNLKDVYTFGTIKEITNNFKIVENEREAGVF